jgi:signal transduction histidine kinase
MRRAGGQAEIRSSPGAGTEVALAIARGDGERRDG